MIFNEQETIDATGNYYKRQPAKGIAGQKYITLKRLFLNSDTGPPKTIGSAEGLKALYKRLAPGGADASEQSGSNSNKPTGDKPVTDGQLKAKKDWLKRTAHLSK